MDQHSQLSSSDAPVRALGPIDATCIVIGAIIGVGIFFNPSRVAQLCPSTSQALLAWAIGGGIALCGALVFAEIGGMYKGQAAHYQALRDSYGPLVGFLFVFCNATVIVAGSMAIIAIVCAQHLLQVAGNDKPPVIVVTTLACLLIAGLMVANILGVKWGSRIQNLTVYAKVLTLIAITLVAFFYSGERAAESTTAEVTRELGFIPGLMAALVSTLFAYGGWQQVLWISGEVKNPSRNLPLAIVGGVALVVTVYLLVNWAYLHLLGPAGVAQSATLAADAVAVALPGLGRRVVAAAVAMSAFGVLNVQLLTGPRLIFGLARDGRFFTYFARLHHHLRTPLPAIVLLAFLGTALVIIAGESGSDRLLNAVVLIDGVFFVLTGLALIVLRIRRPDMERPMRVPLMWIVLSIFLIGEIGLVIGAHLDPKMRWAALAGFGWLAFSAIIYFAFFRQKQIQSA